MHQSPIFRFVCVISRCFSHMVCLCSFNVMHARNGEEEKKERVLYILFQEKRIIWMESIICLRFSLWLRKKPQQFPHKVAQTKLATINFNARMLWRKAAASLKLKREYKIRCRLLHINDDGRNEWYKKPKDFHSRPHVATLQKGRENLARA